MLITDGSMPDSSLHELVLAVKISAGFKPRSPDHEPPRTITYTAVLFAAVCKLAGTPSRKQSEVDEVWRLKYEEGRTTPLLSVTEDA